MPLVGWYARERVPFIRRGERADAVKVLTERRSIRTVYQGTRFRSKLEADWARVFDAIGMEWIYEQEGRYFGDVFYLPDFYLPRSGQYIEVKGVFEPNDVRKIRALLEHLPARNFTGDDTPDIAIIACVPKGDFYGWNRAKNTLQWEDFVMKGAVKVCLFQCSHCRGWWFLDETQSYRCQCCGADDGDDHLANGFGAPIPDFPDLTRLKDLCAT